MVYIPWQGVDLTAGRNAVFLDRDGVLIEDVHLLVCEDSLKVLRGVPQALAQLSAAGCDLIVVTNQTVVARGLATEREVDALHRFLSDLIRDGGGPTLDKFYVCPHHPNADLDNYRQECLCRKPKPGLLLRAAKDYGIDLAESFMVGDRLSDIVAGRAAGCRTIQVATGQHTAKRIESTADINWDVHPHYECSGLPEAVDWILETVNEEALGNLIRSEKRWGE